MTKIDPYRKAVFAFLSSLIGAAWFVVEKAGSFAQVPQSEWLMVALFVVIQTGGVFGLRNEDIPKPNIH